MLFNEGPFLSEKQVLFIVKRALCSEKGHFEVQKAHFKVKRGILAKGHFSLEGQSLRAEWATLRTRGPWPTTTLLLKHPMVNVRNFPFKP